MIHGRRKIKGGRIEHLMVWKGLGKGRGLCKRGRVQIVVEKGGYDTGRG